ncbi:M67 family metallopeptidase [Trichormus sp. NMC-1]|uniref:Mov34/MPN/PAD-1 family protein n=1 Tax=Trichormus sp. NMC-1 TaxID=1853259 RepID=UPI0008DC02AD|nr:M67 family metallopeptidase [Trichormus sp. NMC-1]
MNLKLHPEHLQIINNHAESTYPEECCGIMLGHMAEDSKTLITVIPTENAWNQEAVNFTVEAQSTKRRYAIAPAFMLQMQREARNRNLSIIGIYHSHPDHPAIPSEWDRLYAWPEYSYIIVSVENGKAGKLQSWSLDENHQFQLETIEHINLTILS